MPRRVVHVETLKKPSVYGGAQIADALAKATEIDRGKFVYTIPPPHDHGEQLDANGVCVFCRRRTWL